MNELRITNDPSRNASPRSIDSSTPLSDYGYMETGNKIQMDTKALINYVIMQLRLYDATYPKPEINPYTSPLIYHMDANNSKIDRKSTEILIPSELQQYAVQLWIQQKQKNMQYKQIVETKTPYHDYNKIKHNYKVEEKSNNNLFVILLLLTSGLFVYFYFINSKKNT